MIAAPAELKQHSKFVARGCGLHKIDERRADAASSQLKASREYESGKSDTCLRTIDQLSHDIVSIWVTENSIQVRPSEKVALKELIATQVLQYIAADTKRVVDPSPEIYFERGRLSCIDAISELKEEPFIGFICKQRALNACVQRPDDI